MKKAQNNYELGRKLIHESDFSVKAVKTFMGMEGTGVNANIYFKNRKIGDVIDSGNGGELRIKYYIGESWMHKNKDVTEFLNTLPKHTFEEKGYDFRMDEVTNFDEEEMWNELITMAIAKRDYKKEMKKVVVISKDNQLCFYNHYTPHELQKPYESKDGKIKPLKDILIDDHGNKMILNLLSESESFDVWFNHAYNKGGK